MTAQQQRTIAIYGAGPALGLSTADRFADGGYRVRLVARNSETLDRLCRTLEARGADVEYFLADLTEPGQVGSAAAQIERTTGIPDVIVYSPGDVSRLPVSVTDLDAETLANWLPLNLLSPVELADAVVPGMLSRGSGVLLFAQGTAVHDATPALASSSVAQAALLNYIHALTHACRNRGVRAISVQIGQLIERSAAAALFDNGAFDEIEPNSLPRITPETIAEQLWTLAHDSNSGDEHLT